MHHIRRILGGSLAVLGGVLAYHTAPWTSDTIALIGSIFFAAGIAFGLFPLFCKAVGWTNEAR